MTDDHLPLPLTAMATLRLALSRRLAAGALAALTALGTMGVLCALPAHGATATDQADDPALELRVNQVSAELRCLVCQNQSLADSHAGLAIDLKNQVREQLRAGRSDQQVVDYMTERYGDFVRYRPAFKATTLLLWLGPFVLGLGLLAALWRTLARVGAARAAADPSVDAARALAATRMLDTPQR